VYCVGCAVLSVGLAGGTTKKVRDEVRLGGMGTIDEGWHRTAYGCWVLYGDGDPKKNARVKGYGLSFTERDGSSQDVGPEGEAP